MDAKRNGECAAFVCADGGQHQQGLTKREYIATKVLAGVIAQGGIAGYECYGITPENAAKASVQCADALLAELAKEVKP